MPHRSALYELTIDLDTQKWGVGCPLDQTLIGPVQYGWDRFQKDPNSMTFGGGLLAGSPLPGTRRMIICGYSPQWEGFYVSALGGAMYVFHRVGVNFIWLRGRSSQPVVLVIKLEKGETSVLLEHLDPEPFWKGYADTKGRFWEGFYGLEHAIFDRYSRYYMGDQFRILAVGPGASLTRDGAIGSNQVKKGDLSQIDDWAGRGGLGSRLFQYHRVAGIIFGGDWADPALKEAKELDEYFLRHFGQRAIVSDLALSQKYRYVPEFETGGTFGVNMREAEDKLFSFNYQSVKETDASRLEQHKGYILGHYLKQFNEEIIEKRNFDHCGEPCPIACKKYIGKFKKDYEPYEAMGPNCGIFDQRAAEKVNEMVDTLGLDAIQTGGMVSWMMELLTRKLVHAEDFNLELENSNFNFSSSPDDFDIVADSDGNASLAVAILKMILFSEEGLPFRKGIRSAARYLDHKYGIDSINYAVFNAHGSEGCMVPNQYWVPGMFSPMPMMGKYFSYYGVDFLSPRMLGRKNVERFVYELYSENTGSCRFHRKWIEDIIDEIILTHFDIKLDFWQSNFALAKSIHDFQSKNSVYWESSRIEEIINAYLEKWKRDGLENPELDAWLARFKQDRHLAAKAYWNELMEGMADAFREGMNEPMHHEHGFIEKSV